MAVIGALREGLDLTDCTVFWEPSYAFDEYLAYEKQPVQGSLRLANTNGYLGVPVVWDEKGATILITNEDESTSNVFLQEYCLENAFEFSVRPDGIVTFIADGNAPEGDITIPLMVDGKKLDSVTFAITNLTSGAATLTLDSNAGGGAGT